MYYIINPGDSKLFEINNNLKVSITENIDENLKKFILDTNQEATENNVFSDGDNFYESLESAFGRLLTYSYGLNEFNSFDINNSVIVVAEDIMSSLTVPKNVVAKDYEEFLQSKREARWARPYIDEDNGEIITEFQYGNDYFTGLSQEELRYIKYFYEEKIDKVLYLGFEDGENSLPKDCSGLKTGLEPLDKAIERLYNFYYERGFMYRIANIIDSCMNEDPLFDNLSDDETIDLIVFRNSNTQTIYSAGYTDGNSGKSKDFNQFKTGEEKKDRLVEIIYNLGYDLGSYDLGTNKEEISPNDVIDDAESTKHI